MNVVIYARYSSSSQREASIEEQIKAFNKKANIILNTLDNIDIEIRNAMI